MKYLIILIPIFSFSQINEDFLTTLFIDSTKIQNQEFKLDLAGFINTKGQKIKIPYGNNQYVTDDEDNYYLSEVLFLDDVLMAQQKKSEVYLGDYDSSMPDDFKNRCSWNWEKNKNLKMIASDSVNLFPTLSFIKGKLLTIKQTNSSKDYLFSVPELPNKNYGYKNMIFDLTDDNEKAYTINTLIIDGQSFIALSPYEMRELGFETNFSDESEFKILCDYFGDKIDSTDNSFNWRKYDCYCSCDKNYLKVFKKKTLHMDRVYNLDQDKIIFLFKLVEIK
jgi:hypothetical protein